MKLSEACDHEVKDEVKKAYESYPRAFALALKILVSDVYPMHELGRPPGRLTDRPINRPNTSGMSGGQLYGNAFERRSAGFEKLLRHQKGRSPKIWRESASESSDLDESVP